MPDLDPVAPAQPADSTPPAPPPLTAAEQAAASDDLPSFKAARAAERAGKPITVAEPPTAAPPAEAAPAPPTLNYKERKQQEANDRIRERVAAAVAERDVEIARLRALIAPPPAPAQAAPTPDDFPDYPEYLQTHPNTSLRDYNRALNAHDERARFDARRSQDSQTREATAVEKARASVAEAAKDKAFAEKIHPLLSTLKTYEQVTAAGTRPDALNVFTSLIERSEHAAAILGHLADHPDTLDTIRALQSTEAVLEYFGYVKGSLTHRPSAPAPTAPPKTLTDAPEIPTVLGSRSASPADPIHAAIVSDNYEGFKAARQQARLVQAGRR